MSKVAVIRIRGPVKVKGDIELAMHLLKLNKVNHCRMVNDSPGLRGTLQKISSYVTWGELDAETTKLLEPKAKDGLVRLQPPLGGFERKGIKLPYNQKGVLGDRKEKINLLIKKMLH